MANRTTIPVPKIEEDGYDWYAKHERILQLQRENQFELVLVGDSIMHNWSGDGPGKRDIGIENWRKNLAKYKVLTRSSNGRKASCFLLFAATACSGWDC